MSTVDFNDMQGGPSVPPMAPGPIPQAHPTSRWPKVIGIIAIVLGSLGALVGCVGRFGPRFTDMIKEVAEGQPGTAATVVQLELAAEWATWTIVQSICGLAVGVVLILAGVGLLKGGQEPAVAGVYADSAFAAMADVLVKEVSDRTPIPRWGAQVLEPGIVRAARWFKGIDLAAVRPEAAVPRYAYAIGLTHCQDDERIPIEHLWRLRDAASLGPQLTVYTGCGHTEGYEDYPAQYVAEVASYFNERLGE